MRIIMTANSQIRYNILLADVCFTPADWNSLPLLLFILSLSQSGSGSRIPRMDGGIYRRLTRGKPRSGLKWGLGLKPVYLRDLYPTEKKGETDKHSLLLSSLSSHHPFLIPALLRNPNIPAVESHCWIPFPTILCSEHIETNTHGDCYPFKRPCNPTISPLGPCLFFPPSLTARHGLFHSSYSLTTAAISVN